MAAGDTVVVVVRHAEKATDDPRDPNLSVIGQTRADSLAKTLADYPLTSAFVTEYKRTLQTAEPTLRSHKVIAKIIPTNSDTANSYGHRLAELIKREHKGEVILVVGHSHTVPAILLALTGVHVAPIVESSEFNRLYIITLPTHGTPRVIAANY